MRFGFIFVLTMLLVGCDVECKTGDQCSRNCPDHAWGICTENGMCRCQDFLEIVQEEKYVAMADCDHPQPGDLIINEVLIDGEPTEAGEFLELVNTSHRSIRLDGVSIFVSKGLELSKRFAIAFGCVAPKGALLIEGNSAQPRLEPSWRYEASYHLRRFGFSNSADFMAEIRLFDLTVLDRVELSHNQFRPGVSLVRNPDIVGHRFVDHRIASNGAMSSKGTCADGRPLVGGCERIESGCLSPHPEWLVINEVMVDAEPESREYVEIANNTDKAVDLSGLKLVAHRAESKSTKLEIWSGCLMPNELVAFFSHDSEALGRDRLLSELVFDAHRFRFSNSTETRLTLVGMNDEMLDEFTVAVSLIDENTSVNRYPDVRGSEIMRHDRVYDARSSPGLRARRPLATNEASSM